MKAMTKNKEVIPKSKMKVSKAYRTFQVFNTLIMIFVLLITLYPFVYLVAQSFSSESAIVAGKVNLLPVDFNVFTYMNVIKQGNFIRYYGNTVVYSITGTFLSILFCSMLAYPLSKPFLRGNKVIGPMIIFTMYFGGGLIPNYVLMTSLGLKDTVAAFLLPGLIGTYYVLLMRSFFASIPQDLEEAGLIDGLTHVGTFFRITLPLSKPIIATMFLFNLTGYWSSWFNAFLYLDTKSKWPVAYYLRQVIAGASGNAALGNVAEANQVAANIKSCCMVLTALPLICIYPFIQKHFVQGMMLGGVKE